jgi:hypothetical protein
MLNKDYDPYDQLEYLTNGYTELAGLLNRQTKLMDDAIHHIRHQDQMIQDLNMRLMAMETHLL